MTDGREIELLDAEAATLFTTTGLVQAVELLLEQGPVLVRAVLMVHPVKGFRVAFGTHIHGPECAE